MFMMTTPILFPHKSTINVDLDLLLVYDNHAMPHQSYSVVVSTIVPKNHTYIRGTLSRIRVLWFGIYYMVWHYDLKEECKASSEPFFYIFFYKVIGLRRLNSARSTSSGQCAVVILLWIISFEYYLEYAIQKINK